MKFSSIFKAISYFWNAKKIWHKPGKAKILICDRSGSESLLTYLDSQSVKILDMRGESINLYVLLKCSLQWKLTMLNYMVQYLKCVKPSVAITFIDNNHLFYLLKSHQEDLTTVFIQNAIRGELGDVFGFLKMQPHIHNKYQVDYMFTFGNAASQQCSRYIDGTTLPIGSFKNNLCQSKTKKQLRSVLFISQYRPPPSSEGNPILVQGNKPIFWKQLQLSEEILLPLLQRYCRQNKLELKICGHRADEAVEEHNYFRTILGNGYFEFLEKRDTYSSYENVAAAEFVVFFESTLGYEALARGKKTAAFSVRGKSLGSAEWNFGPTVDLPESGPFWTNHADEHEVKRVMDYITAVNDEEWEQTRQRYISELIEYDPGNTRFLKLMRELRVPLKAEYQRV